MADRAHPVPSPTRNEPYVSMFSMFLTSAYGASVAIAGRTRVSALAIVASLAVGGMVAVGCTSDEGGTFPEYEGTWRTSVDPAFASAFLLDCPSLPEPYHEPYPLFTTVRLEPGTETDLFDVAGPGTCLFGYDHVNGKKTLALPNPDPFTGVSVKCLINVGNSTDPDTSDPISKDLFITPANWSFNLQPAPKGKPPLAQLVGEAVVDLVETAFNSDRVPRTISSFPCTFSIAEYLEKVAKL
ncbi:MAG: hypothetical protein ABIS92_12625 [Polyangia bacterium]